MAVGLFNWEAKELYTKTNLTYADHCAVNRPEFAAAHICEKLIRSRFPTASAPPPGQFLPFFVHCQDARVYVDQRTGSRQCPGQVDISLAFAVRLVKGGVKPSQITVFSPYATNVQLVVKHRKLSRYAALTGMEPASMVDAFQGRENDIIIVNCMGTTFLTPGPGCTTDSHRLKVLLTRRRCGLVVVGDFNILAGEGNAGKKEVDTTLRQDWR